MTNRTRDLNDPVTPLGLVRLIDASKFSSHLFSYSQCYNNAQHSRAEREETYMPHSPK